MSHFSKETIKDKLVISLFFKRHDDKSSIMDLYLAGTIRAKFWIDTEELDDNGEKLFKYEENAPLVDTVQLQPRKELQKLLGKHLKADELLPLLEEGSKGKVDELIQSLFYKLNKIYAKSKLYGREIKGFDLV